MASVGFSWRGITPRARRLNDETFLVASGRNESRASPRGPFGRSRSQAPVSVWRSSRPRSLPEALTNFGSAPVSGALSFRPDATRNVSSFERRARGVIPLQEKPTLAIRLGPMAECRLYKIAHLQSFAI